MASVMLNSMNVSKRMWAEALNTACYLTNRFYLRPGTTKTPYEFLKGRKPNLAHLRVFGCTCYILNDRDKLSKFDPKSEKGIFVGYSINSHAYMIYVPARKTIMELVNVVFNDCPSDAGIQVDEETESVIATLTGDIPCVSNTPEADPVPASTDEQVDQVDPENSDSEVIETQDAPAGTSTDSSVVTTPSGNRLTGDTFRRDPLARIRHDHPITQVIGEVTDGRKTRVK